MKKEKGSKKALAKKSKGHKLFKTKEGIVELFKYESDKYYLTMGGNILTFNDKGIFSKEKAVSYYENMIVSICQVITMPRSHKERQEAIEGLRTLLVLPFRVH